MGDSETLTSEYASGLLQRQDALQAEAKIVLANLDIIRLLSQLGNPKQLGSSALGLMVWPDIDLTVSCPGLTIERALDICGSRMYGIVCLHIEIRSTV